MAEKTPISAELQDAVGRIVEEKLAAYVPLEDDCWKLYVVYDGDCLADLVKRLISGIRKAEKLPSVPLLDLQLVHASESAGMPGNSRTIFAKT